MIYAYFVGLILGCLIGGLMGYMIGKGIGRSSKKIALSGLGASEAMAFYLKKEIIRHTEDIERGLKELKILREKGFEPPDIPLDVWIDVKK